MLKSLKRCANICTRKNIKQLSISSIKVQNNTSLKPSGLIKTRLSWDLKIYFDIDDGT